MSARINRSTSKSIIPTVVTLCDVDAVRHEPQPETDEFGAINLSTSGGRSRDDSTQPTPAPDSPPEVAAFTASTTFCDRERRAGPSHVTAPPPPQLQQHHPTRMLMRDWLIEQAESGDVPGLEWLDTARTLMKIPWIHASKSVWSRDDHCKLFENWAIYTGKYLSDRDQPNPRRWKANFRCALNSLPGIEEESTLSCKNGENGFKVYRFSQTSRSQMKKEPDKTHIPNTADDEELAGLCGDVENEVTVVAEKKRKQNDTDVKHRGKTISEKGEGKILGQVYHVVTPSPVGRNGDHCYYIQSKLD